MSNWNLKEAPIAYYRNGDSSEYIDVFKKNGCIVKEHPFGYRSVHYLVITSPNKSTYVAEVQVRTIFEEGWSEIDHRIRYPYDTKNNLLNQFLVIFNRLSGSADEMGSYVQNLKYELAKREKEFAEDLNKKVQIIEDLKGKIRELELQPKVAKEWVNNLDEILKLSKSTANQYEFKLPDFTQMEFPDYSSIKLFDTSKLKLPDYTEVKWPDYTKMKLPDYTEVKLPDFSGLQKSDNKEEQHSKNNLEKKPTTAKRKSTPSKKKPKTNIKKPNQQKTR